MKKISKYIIDISYHNGVVDLNKAKKYIARELLRDVPMDGVHQISINSGTIMQNRLMN